MFENHKRFFLRINTIVKGALFRTLFLFSNLIISLVIIRSHGTEIWGEIVYYLLILDLAFAVIGWGQAPYLTREFSLHPAGMRTKFSQAFTSRAYILLVFASVLWFTPVSPHIKTVLTIWAVARYIYQSFYPVIQHQRKFLRAFIVEAIGILLVVLPLTSSLVDSSSIVILNLYAISFAVRAVLTLVQNNQMLTIARGDLSFTAATSFLIAAFPFLLLTFSAMLHERPDVYIVAIFLTSEKVAEYQVFLNLLLFGQLGASLLLSPFSKNIFRLPVSSFQKLERQFMAAGLGFSLVTVIFIYLIVTFIYQFNLSWSLYLLGYFYGLMFYFYLLRNYKLGKAYKQARVALYSFLGFVVNVVLSYLITPRFGIEGALCAATITQAFIAILFFTNPFLKTAHATR